MNKFWNWVRNEDETRTLHLEGVISETSWFDDEVTPAAFKADLMAQKGPITVWINSPGGDCVAAAQIYNMLMDYPDDVTVKVDGLAASAASVIAMAGSRVLMSPASLMMIHNPLTFAMGDSEEMKKAMHLLDEVKESIINAYEIKTGMKRERLSQLMDAETWMNANKAREYGFCDEIMFLPQSDQKHSPEAFVYSRRAVTNSLLTKLLARGLYNGPPMQAAPSPEPKQPMVPEPLPQPEPRIKAADLEKRLSLLK